MKNIKTFEQHTKIYEMVSDPTSTDYIVGLAQLATPFIALGLFRGYGEIARFIDKMDFKMAKAKIGPIFDKIKDDRKIQELLGQLQQYKNSLYFGEEEGENPMRDRAYDIRSEFYKRTKELLSEKDYKVFIEACNEFEDGVGTPAGYFIDKDAEYTRYRKYGRKPNRIR